MGVTAEVDRIAAAGLPFTDKTGWAQLTAAFPSADQLLDEIQVGSPDRVALPSASPLGSCCLLDSDHCTLCCGSAALGS